MSPSARTVVITGVGVLAPNGNDVSTFWKSILEKRSGIGLITAFDASDLPCRLAGEVKQFAPLRYIPAALRPEKRMSRASQLGVAAARMALEHAGLTDGRLDLAGDIPVAMGVSSSALELRDRPPAAWMTVGSIPHIVASTIAYILGIRARLLTVSTGCCSGLDAVALAVQEIREGRADVAIAGSGDSLMSRYVFECFALANRLSKRNHDPARASRPFDRDRDGGIASEGAGVVVLESLSFARARGGRPLAIVEGYGSAADAPRSSEGSGLERAMRMALANSCLYPRDISYINAHGPSDPHMDKTETAMIRAVFGRYADRIPVSSIKGVTGNPLGVGCVHQIIAAVLSLRDQVIPPTANWEHADPDCNLDYVPEGPRRADVRAVLINTHGFGRGNSSLVLRRVDGEAP